MLFLAVYVVLGVVLSPLAMLVVLVGGVFKRDWWDDARARFGRPPTLNDQRPIVIWCASVGEVNTARELIKGLLKLDKAPVVIATYTPTGLQRAHALFGERATVTLAPLDMLPFSRRWVERLRPCLLVLFETELWPLTLRIAHDNEAKLAVINARVSDRTFPRYRLFRFVFRPTLRRMSLVATQNELFKDRLIKLGARPQKTIVTGSMKFTVPEPVAPDNDVAAIYRSFCDDHQIVIGGSTHSGEEKIMAEALTTLQKKESNLRMIIAPRHVKRAAEAVRDLAGFKVVLRSQTTPEEAGKADVLLIDVLGELTWAYGLADVAFVGGSFVKVGGHNVVEPAAFGVPVLVGPHTPNFRQEVEMLQQGDGLQVIADSEKLFQTLQILLNDDEYRKAMGQAGRRVVETHQGATEKTLQALRELLA